MGAGRLGHQARCRSLAAGPPPFHAAGQLPGGSGYTARLDLDPPGRTRSARARRSPILPDLDFASRSLAAAAPSSSSFGTAAADREREVMEIQAVVRPRFVWGRRPRPNGGRRRPRGRMGYPKYPPVVSRGSYPVSTKPAAPPAPTLDQFPLCLFGFLPQLSGNTFLNRELLRLALLYGLVARIRLLLLARAMIWTPFPTYRETTGAHWKEHEKLLKTAEGFRRSLVTTFGVEIPAVPPSFYHKF